ncbi:MAG: lysophospholipid acyltransferase family protein [Dehalococcoidia bacterium]
MAKYAVLWLLVHGVGRLPARLLYAATALAGTLAWHLSRRIRATTRDHARHVLGIAASRRAVDATARACARSTSAYYADLARYARMTPEAVIAQVESFEGWEHLTEASDRGDGVVLVSAHLGCPEVMAQAAAAFNLHIGVVTEPLHPPRVHRLMDRVRGRHGVRLFAADLGGLREARTHLKHGGALGLVVDRDVLGSGRPYPFFGEPTRMPTGAVELALRTGAPMVAVWVLRGSRPERMRIRVEPVPLPAASGDRQADLDSGMAALLRCMERAIAGAPGQWFALSPIWGGLASDGHPAAPLH